MKTKENKKQKNSKNIFIIFILVILLIMCVIYYVYSNKKQIYATSNLNIKNIKISNTNTIDIEEIISRNTKEKAREEIIVEETELEYITKYKNKKTHINEQDRAEIVNSIKYVDRVYITSTLDKNMIFNQIKFC